MMRIDKVDVWKGVRYQGVCIQFYVFFEYGGLFDIGVEC